MMIRVYGQEGCRNCGEVATVFGDAAQYYDIQDIWTYHPPEIAGKITTATGGTLPIVVVERDGEDAGLAVFRLAALPLCDS